MQCAKIVAWMTLSVKNATFLFFLEHPPLEIFFAKRSLLFVSKTEAVVAGQPHP